MKRRANIITPLFLGLLLIFPFTAFSAPEAGETVTKRGTINDDYYAAGRTIDIDADIAGDVVVSGGKIFVGHQVQGDVMAAGGSISIRGEILDDVRAAGGEVTVDAKIGDDLLAAGGAIRVAPESSIAGEARLAGGDVHVAGAINKGLFIAASNIRISGSIYGDVELFGEEIQILEGALIKGNLLYKSPNEATISAGAKIVGNVSHEQASFDQSHRGAGIGSAILFFLTLIVASIVLFLLFPNFTMASAKQIKSAPWKSLGVGFIILFVTPIVVALLMMTVLGVWVGLSVLALYFVALLLGLLIAFFFLGDWVAKLIGQDVTTKGRRLLFVAMVILLLALIQFIPVIRGLLIFVLLILGLGAGSLQIHHAYSHNRETNTSNG